MKTRTCKACGRGKIEVTREVDGSSGTGRCRESRSCVRGDSDMHRVRRRVDGRLDGAIDRQGLESVYREELVRRAKAAIGALHRHATNEQLERLLAVARLRVEAQEGRSSASPDLVAELGSWRASRAASAGAGGILEVPIRRTG